ncbi:MAG: hypothetical protein Q7S84_04145 [bacterium]|nr:hypothetical protein [bacterium]
MKNVFIKKTCGALLALIALGAALLLIKNSLNNPWEQFSLQTRSFLEGHLYIPPQSFDTAVHDGRHYWPQGPFPSITLIPGQLIFGPEFTQGAMQGVLVVILATLLYKLTRLKHYSRESAVYLAAAFLLSSPAVGVIVHPGSWYFSQVVTLTLLVALLFEWEMKRRPLLMGLLVAALIATRPTAAFFGLIIVFALISKKHAERVLTVRTFASFLIPILITAATLLWLNYARFGNPFDNGYATNHLGSPLLENMRTDGVFNILYIPRNIFFYFFMPFFNTGEAGSPLTFPFVTYSSWGLSFFIVAPFFLYAAKSLRLQEPFIKQLWLTVALTLLVLLSFAFPGAAQFGPRYILDLVPLLYLLILYGLTPPDLTRTHQFIILTSGLFNVYLLATSPFA